MQLYLGREGACEEGSVIGDVILPAWADSSHEFIHMHREVYTHTYMYIYVPVCKPRYRASQYDVSQCEKELFIY